MPIMKFEDSDAWQLARSLRKDIWNAVRSSQCYRDLEFDHQIYSAALSVMNNIAEGWEAPSPGEKARFFSYSLRSCGETRSMLTVGIDDGIFNMETFEKLMRNCVRTTNVVAGLFRGARSRAP